MSIVEMLPPSVVELHKASGQQRGMSGLGPELAKQILARGAGVLYMWVRHEGDARAAS